MSQSKTGGNPGPPKKKAISASTSQDIRSENNVTKGGSASSSIDLLSTKESPIMFDRSMWVIMNLVGKMVEVQVKSGDIFEGILHTVGTEKGMGVMLKMARKKRFYQNGLSSY